MAETLVLLVSSFWLGAVHAATPGHGKTIAAAYIVGARGRPVDALVLGIFVTLSHTSGIVLVGVLASLGSAWLIPHRVEAYLALATGALVVAIGVWMLISLRPARDRGHAHAHTHDHPHGPNEAHDPGRHAHTREHDHPRGPDHAHQHGNDRHAQVHERTDVDHAHTREHGHAGGPDLAHEHGDGGHAHTHGAGHGHSEEDAGYHSHGWGRRHTHRLDAFADDRPSLAMLLGLGIAGGLLPDPGALAILLAAIASGRVLLGLFTVVVFSIGFASVLVVVGIVAARVGRLVLTWLEGRWVAWVQTGAALVIVVVGLVLTATAWRTVTQLP